MKGFTVLEMLVVMGVIIMLIIIAGLGISTTQRSSRDTERKEVLKAISNELIDYFGNHQFYPPSTVFVWDSTAKTLTINNINTFRLSAVTNLAPPSASASSFDGSIYCYGLSNNNRSYTIGVNLESGNWYNLGPGTACSARSF